MGANLRFVFLTGITRFEHVGIFSGLNNLNDISLDEEYAALCGITQQELEENFQEGLQNLLKIQQRTNPTATMADVYQKLRDKYDGYHFTPALLGPEDGVYNPFSLLQAMNKGLLQNYWFSSGAPAYLAEMMAYAHFTVGDLLTSRISMQALGDVAISDYAPAPSSSRAAT